MAFALEEGCATAMPCVPLFPIVGDSEKVWLIADFDFMSDG